MSSRKIHPFTLSLFKLIYSFAKSIYFRDSKPGLTKRIIFSQLSKDLFSNKSIFLKFRNLIYFTIFPTKGSSANLFEVIVYSPTNVSMLGVSSSNILHNFLVLRFKLLI